MKDHVVIRRLRAVAGNKEQIMLLSVGDLNTVEGETVPKDLVLDLYQVVGSIRNYKTLIR